MKPAAWLIASTLALAGARAHAEETEPSAAHANSSDLSQRATDPSALVLSFNFKFEITTSTWDTHEHNTLLRFQPLIPFQLWHLPNLVRLTSLFQICGSGADGLESLTILHLIVFGNPSFRWALGPVYELFPNARSSPTKLTLGPAIALVWHVSHKFKLGVLNQNYFGDQYQTTQLQPVAAYELGAGWSVAIGEPQFTYNWHKGRWTLVPLSVELGAVYRIADQPVRFFVEPRYNVLDYSGSDKFTLIAGFKLFAPGAFAAD